MPVELRVMAFSNAVGKSLAPGGTVLLLGLPCGVLVGLRKLLVVLVGVVGRTGVSSVDLSLPLGKKLDMKLAMMSICNGFD